MEIDINNLTAYQEDHRIEAKTAKNQIPNNIWDTYSSFANTEGGIILLGVVEENDHSLSVKGVEDAHKLIGDFWNMVNNRQKVSVNILTNNMVYEQEVEGKQIVVIEVPRADRTIRPVYIGQDPMRGTYVRYGEGDHLCNRDQVAAIYRGIIDCGVHFLFRSNLVRMEVGKMKSLCIRLCAR
jgi:predicted HTH transcriptional regulator